MGDEDDIHAITKRFRDAADSIGACMVAAWLQGDHNLATVALSAEEALQAVTAVRPRLIYLGSARSIARGLPRIRLRDNVRHGVVSSPALQRWMIRGC